MDDEVRDREHNVIDAFVTLVNSLVDDFDAVELLTGLVTECARMLDIATAGVLLADDRDVLHLVAASSEATRDLELFQLQREQGPCLDSFRDGTRVVVADLTGERQRWPSFVEAALGAGFASVHAVPMRLQDRRLGTLGLFGTHVGTLADDDLHLAQALAHVGSVAIVQARVVADSASVAEQLQHALSSRVVLEQAKGLVAQLGDLDMDRAFQVIRTYARDRNERLSEVAEAVVTRRLPTSVLLEHARARAVRPHHRDR